MSSRRAIRKIEFGDFQTPPSLAVECCNVIRQELGSAATIVEPTCGTGAFAVAAAQVFTGVSVIACDVNACYVDQTRSNSAGLAKFKVRKQNFFECDWKSLRNELEGPVLFLGNPPWVTNSQLGTLGSTNVPQKSNWQRVRGIEAMTGRSNFDISESILQTLMEVMRPHDMLAMLVKTATARRVLKHAWSQHLHFDTASMRRIESRRHFGVNVDAGLLLLRRTELTKSVQVCLRSNDLTTPAVDVAMGWHEGKVVADPIAAMDTKHLQTSDEDKVSALRWRSGVKHDVSGVLELTRQKGALCTRKGERICIESDLVFPLAKGADVANSRTECHHRRILLPQLCVSDDTETLRHTHPKTMQYLESQESVFAMRKSSIYRSRDRFALFGIGPYTFAPWKIAICGLYKRLTFTLFGQVESRPVIFDDTIYFLSLENQQQANFVIQLLRSAPAVRFFQARIFWDAKRPITAELLRRLDLSIVAEELGLGHNFQELFTAN